MIRERDETPLFTWTLLREQQQKYIENTIRTSFRKTVTEEEQTELIDQSLQAARQNYFMIDPYLIISMLKKPHLKSLMEQKYNFDTSEQNIKKLFEMCSNKQYMGNPALLSYDTDTSEEIYTIFKDGKITEIRHKKRN